MRITAVITLILISAFRLAQAQTPTPTTDPKPADRISLPEPADAKLPSLILIGDSTVRNGRDDGQGKGPEGQWGWGNPIAALFESAKINVVNRAVGGLSSRTYLTGGHWERTLAFIKPGDFIVMQFGHNDSGALNDKSRARGTIKGTGEETEEIDNLITGKHEVVHTYGWYLRKFINEARAKGATPIVCSPIPRKSWDEDDLITRNKNSYTAWAGEVAKQENAAFINLNELAARRYDELGRDEVMKLFPQVTPDEHTHTNWVGAELNARLVVAGLKSIKDHPLLAFLSAKAGDIAPADLSGPPPFWAKPKPAEDDRPVVDASKIREEKVVDGKLPTFFLVGDSTVRSGGQNGAIGWGERITPFFDAAKINVVNRAIGGRSSRTFFTEGRWDKVLAEMKAGDFVIIQFGHNDLGRIGDPAAKRRPSGRGIGPETMDDPKPDGTPELVHTFGWYMSRYVADAKAKGATVILCSPIPHKDKWENERDFAQVAEWDTEVAKAGGALYFDLTMVITNAYRKIGRDKVETFFSDRGTHTNSDGGEFNAACVIAGLKTLPGNPLAPFLSAKGHAVETTVP